MKTLKVEFNARLPASNPTPTFLGGYAVFRHVSWPKKELHEICREARISDVNLAFDRYHPDSIKRLTSMNRDTGATRVCNFLPDMQLLSRHVVLKVTKNG